VGTRRRRGKIRRDTERKGKAIFFDRKFKKETYQRKRGLIIKRGGVGAGKSEVGNLVEQL